MSAMSRLWLTSLTQILEKISSVAECRRVVILCRLPARMEEGPGEISEATSKVPFDYQEMRVLTCRVVSQNMFHNTLQT